MSAISREAASLIRTERWAALATLDEGWPLASMVAYLLEEEHCGLLFFLRQLSQHTQGASATRRVGSNRGVLLTTLSGRLAGRALFWQVPCLVRRLQTTARLWL